MGPTHHLVTNVRFRKTKSTVSVKSDFWAHRFYLSIHSRHAEYNSSEIDKIRYCPTDRKEGLRPLSLPYNEKIISKLGQSGYEKRHPVKKRLWPCPEGDRPGRWSFFAGCLLIIVLAADQKLFFVIVTKPFIIDFLVCAVFFKFFKSFVNSLL